MRIVSPREVNNLLGNQFGSDPHQWTGKTIEYKQLTSTMIYKFNNESDEMAYEFIFLVSPKTKGAPLLCSEEVTTTVYENEVILAPNKYKVVKVEPPMTELPPSYSRAGVKKPTKIYLKPADES